MDLSAAYGWTPDQINKLTFTQLWMYLRGAASAYFKSLFPVAQLTASVLNALGGKAESDGPPRDPSTVFHPVELLPWYARPHDLEDPLSPTAIRLSTAQEFIRLSRGNALPDWVIGVAPIHDIWRVIDGSKHR